MFEEIQSQDTEKLQHKHIAKKTVKWILSGNNVAELSEDEVCHESKQRLQLLQHSLLPGDFVLHIPLPPHPAAAAHHQHLGAEKPLMCRQGAV